MLLGASPFLVAGAVAASIAERLECAKLRSSVRRYAAVAFPFLFPGCDCSMNSYARVLRGQHPALAACAVVWGSCCNPVALLCTARILGIRMMAFRIIAGLAAAGLTALFWSFNNKSNAAVAPVCDTDGGWCEHFVRSCGDGLSSFAKAAGLSCIILIAAPSLSTVVHGPFFAGAVGAILSPCSTADALLAAVLLRGRPDQLVFITAAQCLDIRQLTLLLRSFGAVHTIAASAAALIACTLVYLLASAS